MKRIFFLLFFIPVFAKAQLYQTIPQRSEFKDSIKLDKNKNNAAGDSILSTDINGRIINVIKPAGTGGGGVADIGTLNAQPKNNNGAIIVGDSIYLQTATQRFPGVNSKYDKQRIDRQGIGINKYASVADGNYYNAFASPTAWKDTAYIAIKRGYSHAAYGWIPIMRSVDGGQTWDSVNVITGYGNNPVMTALNDTLFFSYEAGTTNQYFGYIPLATMTVTLSDSVTTAGGSSAPTGKFLQLPSGKYEVPYYSIDATSWVVGFCESTNGINWTKGVTISTGLLGVDEKNETFVEIINPTATSDADVKLIAISRQEEIVGQHVQYNSTGFSTWNRVGLIDQFKDTADLYGYPIEVVLYGGKVYLIGCRRYNYLGVNFDMNIGVSSGIPDQVFNDSSKWSMPNRIYNAEADYLSGGFSVDFGYGFSFILNGQLMIAPYDLSPINTTGSPNTYTRVFVMPVFQNDYTEYYNNLNQSITVSTETLVSTPTIWFDTNAQYDSGTGLFTIKRDGWYSMNAVACYNGQLTGTYRKLYIKVINGITAGDRIVQSQTIQPTDNIDFLRMNINTTQYLRAGEKVGLYTYSDGASDALRNQNEYKNRATFIINKQN